MTKDDVWRITVHPLADGDMKALKQSNPEAFKRMMTALKQLQVSPNLFELPPNLDICYSFPHARDCLRFKQRRDVWRVVLRLVIDGQQVRPTSGHRPCDGYLQIIFVDERSGATYHVKLVARASSVV